MLSSLSVYPTLTHTHCVFHSVCLTYCCVPVNRTMYSVFQHNDSAHLLHNTTLYVMDYKLMKECKDWRCNRDIQQQYRERQRDREARIKTILFKNQQMTTTITNYKVGYILNDLGKMPFMLFTEITYTSLYKGLMLICPIRQLYQTPRYPRR